MDEARCTLDGNLYIAQHFSQLVPKDIAKLRKHLICDECNQKAFFRKASSDNKIACFGAKHLDGCSKERSTSVITSKEREAIELVNRIIKSSDTIILDLAYEDAEDAYSTGTGIQRNCNSYSNPSKLHMEEPAETGVFTCGLESLLRFLIRSQPFSKSEVLIDINGYRWKAKDLFVNFSEVSKDYINEWRGYWGIIYDTSSNVEYLNSGSQNDVSVVLNTPEIQNSIKSRYRISSAEELPGYYLLVFGRLRFTNSGKKLIFPQGEKWLCLKGNPEFLPAFASKNNKQLTKDARYKPVNIEKIFFTSELEQCQKKIINENKNIETEVFNSEKLSYIPLKRKKINTDKVLSRSENNSKTQFKINKIIINIIKVIRRLMRFLSG